MIALCPNPYRDVDLEYTLKLYRMLSERNFICRIYPVFESDTLPDRNLYSYDDINNLSSECTLAVVIGGDGTILSCAANAYMKNIPIFGINLGNMGFLSTCDPDDEKCFEYLLLAAEGKLRTCRRMMLDVTVHRNGECIVKRCVLNDAVIHGYGDCIDLTVLCGEIQTTHLFGDGIILSTPTGSTGYSMSAGGPIVEPGADCIIISPICAHSLSARSFVFGVENRISVITGRLHDRNAYLSADGNNCLDLQNDDVITVCKSNNTITTFEINDSSFYTTIYNKLS